MAAFKQLSRSQCVLLAASLACESNVDALRAITLARADLFDATLIYRLILSFLPETTDPAHYVGYLTDVTERRAAEELDGEVLSAAEAIDVSPVFGLTAIEAEQKLRHLPLRPLRSSFGSSAAASLLREAPDDALVHFLVSRSYAIDRETGLHSILPRLLRPFLYRSRFLRTWYASSVLPLLRYEHEYYGQADAVLGLDYLDELDEQATIGTLMSKSLDNASAEASSSQQVGRDLRGLVGPWTFGSSQRKRRKLGIRSLPLNGEEQLRRNAQIEGDSGIRCKISKCAKLFMNEDAWRAHVEEAHTRLYDSIRQETYRDHDTPRKLMQLDGADHSPTADRRVSWQHTLQWLVNQAVDNFPLAVNAIDGWDGPNDVDLGDADEDAVFADDAETTADHTRMYCQAVLACVYAANDDSPEAIEGAHSCLARLAELLDYIPPPDLVTSVDLLPRIEMQNRPLEKDAKHYLQFENLLLDEQPLTIPNLESYSLLQMLTYSAYQLQSLGYKVSISQISKLCFWSDSKDVFGLLQTILELLSKTTKADPERWTYNRSILLYLWNWALPTTPSGDREGFGVFGKIGYVAFEKEILKTLLAAGQYGVVKQIYIEAQGRPPLDMEVVEASIVQEIYSLYDAASNGNRTRGSMKRAADVLSAFQKSFPTSKSLRKAEALVTATHALSFYSLTFEGGVPTRPERIRETADPIALITKVLRQNAGSYTKLDDLQTIARNLTISLPPPSGAFSDFASLDAITDEQARLNNAVYRVTGAAIEAALAEDDFETAYSYVITRMSPDPKKDTPSNEVDDISWRAAYAAGKHRTSSAPSAAKQTRRLEQRLDLLAQALALAPPPSTPEVLAAWRRAEEELLTVLAETSADDAAADAAADKRLSSGARTLPGGFGDEALDPRMSVQPARREVGRGAVEEAPMGLFDVARGAARAFGRTVEGQRRAAAPAAAPVPAKPAPAPAGLDGDGEGEGEDGAWDDWGEEGPSEERVRKRDVVANSFARGVGWVLGATPVDENQGR